MEIKDINTRFKDKIKVEKLRQLLHQWYWVAATQKWYLESQKCYSNPINDKLVFPTKRNLKKTINTIHKLENKIQKILNKYLNENQWSWEKVISKYCCFEKEANDFLNTLE